MAQMSNRASATEPEKLPKLVGVYVRPRQEHWKEVLACADSVSEALAQGRFAPNEVALPASRMQPVYAADDGQYVIIEKTSNGSTTRPFFSGAELDMVSTAGVAGGFLSVDDTPPLPLAGGGNAADWVRGYMGRIPQQSDLGDRQSRWEAATQSVHEAIAARTQPAEDEWGRKYFSAIREAASKRDAIYLSSEAAPRGALHYTRESAWNREEYHGGLFEQFAKAASQARQDFLVAGAAVPGGLFAHSSAARMLGLAGAIEKNGPGLPAALLSALPPDTAGRIAGTLQAYLTQQAAASDNRGGAMDRLHGAFDLLRKLSDGGGARLADAMLDDLIHRGKSADLSRLQEDIVQQLAQIGISQGLEHLLGSDEAAILSATGVTGLFVDAAKNMVPGNDPGLIDRADTLLRSLPDQLMDTAFDKLLGKVDDRSSMARLLLAKYKDQIKDFLKELLSKDGLANLQKQWDAIWKSMPSKANVRVGWAIGFCANDLVMVNGRPVTRVGDECIYPPPEPPGKFFQGNPTIRVNGMWPSGHIHAAINSKGTIATPMEVSPNVLMGEATVSVDVSIDIENPASRAQTTHADGVTAHGTDGKKQGGTSSRGEKAGMTDEDRRKYQDLQNRDDTLADEQKALFERADRGEISEAQASAEAERLERERDALEKQMADMRQRFDPSEFDEDGYLREHASAPPVHKSPDESDTPLPSSDSSDPLPGSEEALRKARKLRADARRLEGLSNMAALAGQDALSEKYAAAADTANVVAAGLEGGADAAARELEKIGVRRGIEKAVEKGVKLIPPGPVRKTAEWAALPIGDGLGQLSEKLVEWLQKHGYIK